MAFPSAALRRRDLAAAVAALAADPESPTARFAHATALDALGRRDEARAAYLDLLARAPDHVGALNNLGTLLLAGGYRSAAATCYRQAIATHPERPMARINLGNLLLGQGDAGAARTQFEAALLLEPDSADAHRGLALALAELGDDEAAARHRRAAYAGRAVTELPWRGVGRPLRLLLLVAAAGGNVRTQPLLDDTRFAVTVAAPEFVGDEPLPPRDLVFNAIGDADLGAEALDAAGRLLARNRAPLINPPEAVARTGRAALAARLAGVPDLVAPLVRLLPRQQLSTGALLRAGFRFPLLLRAPGFHTGRHFERIERPEALPGSLGRLPGHELLAIEFLDARGADGLYRKYRAMFVDGAILPLHLAISEQWKVHYFTAAMRESSDARAEEAAFLADMAEAIGPRAMTGLLAVRDALALDYGGIDFGLAGDGRLLMFEANATMAVLAPDPDPVWDYRRPAIERVRAAVERMLLARAGRR